MMIIITSLTFRSKTSFYLSPDRKFPLDMAGFAINLRGLLEKSDIQVGLEPNGQPNPLGYLETRLLQKFVTRESVECRGSSKEASRKGGRESGGRRSKWGRGEEQGRRGRKGWEGEGRKKE